MPKVNGKEFAYTDAGVVAAGKAKTKLAKKKAKPKAKAKKGR
tara:strand:+ start:379 stop:504 length:126 start_codon:yes stop_codon:yes gene_type:complete